MAYDGSAWNESSPDNNTAANEIDDSDQDIKKGVRSRMAFEHIWPASQTSTNEGGLHKFVTLQGQTGAPSLVVGTNTQLGAIYVSSGSKALLFEDSAGTSFVLAQSGKGLVAGAGTGTLGAIPVITAGGGFTILAAGSSGQMLVSAGNTAVPAYVDVSTAANLSAIKDYGTSTSASSDITQNNFKFCYGQFSIGGASTVTVTNLPFNDATSYQFVACFGGDTGATEAVVVTQVNGGTASIKSNDNLAQTVHWIAMGV